MKNRGKLCFVLHPFHIVSHRFTVCFIELWQVQSHLLRPSSAEARAIRRAGAFHATAFRWPSGWAPCLRCCAVSRRMRPPWRSPRSRTARGTHKVHVCSLRCWSNPLCEAVDPGTINKTTERRLVGNEWRSLALLLSAGGCLHGVGASTFRRGQCTPCGIWRLRRLAGAISHALTASLEVPALHTLCAWVLWFGLRCPGVVTALAGAGGTRGLFLLGDLLKSPDLCARAPRRTSFDVFRMLRSVSARAPLGSLDFFGHGAAIQSGLLRAGWDSGSWGKGFECVSLYDAQCSLISSVTDICLAIATLQRRLQGKPCGSNGSKTGARAKGIGPSRIFKLHS